MSGNKQNVNRIPQDELAMRSILKDMGVTGTVKELEISNSLVVFHTYTFFLQIPSAYPPFFRIWEASSATDVRIRLQIYNRDFGRSPSVFKSHKT